jgi:L-proline amide hydrolase
MPMQATVQAPPTREGRIAFSTGSTWYRLTGDLDAGPTPLVVLHGGPGVGSDYTFAIADLAAASGRPVVHYDQFGCGRSTHDPDRDPASWSIDFFLDELETVLRALGISDRHAVLGQSWGGMLGAEYGVRRPSGLQALVIANSPASMTTWVAEANRLRRQLPDEVADTLTRHEAAGTTTSSEYEKAVQVFYDRFVCRVVPNPPEVVSSFTQLAADPTVYHTMNGPSEFHVVGSLVGWTIEDRLSAIAVPTLVISGVYDEATPLAVKPFLDHVPDVRWELFESSSHMPHVEQPERYLEVVEGFLAEFTS